MLARRARERETRCRPGSGDRSAVMKVHKLGLLSYQVDDFADQIAPHA